MGCFGFLDSDLSQSLLLLIQFDRGLRVVKLYFRKEAQNIMQLKKSTKIVSLLKSF